jgi:folate-dependent phosphoribosylglycinamide formyltransferase PurN
LKTLLICHHDADLDLLVLAPWLASFSELSGIVVIREDARSQLWKRAKREIRRSGLLGFADVVAFRYYYGITKGKGDAAWEQSALAASELKLPRASAAKVSQIEVKSPNAAEAREFIATARPDIILARCKVILKRDIFTQASAGTFVMHPGHCPEYRNAHGCFWALVRGQPEKVAMTLLKIDEGIDTGPVYGYYSYRFDARRETHIQIQARVLLENLDKLRDKFLEIVNGRATPLPTLGLKSGLWGQPRLVAYLRAKWSGKF